MSRLTGTLLGDSQYDQQNPSLAPQVDVSIGGQYGYQSEAVAYPNNAGYRPSRLISLLYEPPRGFKYINNPEKATAVLKMLMETQSKSITGVRSGLNVTYNERQLDSAGRQQRDIGNVTEEITNPSHTWDERYGRAIHNYWMWYIRTFIGDPVTGQPGIMNMTADAPTDHLPDIYSFTMLYIQPCPLRRNVEEAWMVVGCAPNTSGVLESQYDVPGDTSVPEIAIELGGIPYSNNDVRKIAQEILDGINYINAGPLSRPAYLDKIAADVAAGDAGYTAAIAAAAASGVTG